MLAVVYSDIFHATHLINQQWQLLSSFLTVFKNSHRFSSDSGDIVLPTSESLMTYSISLLMNLSPETSFFI